jgi:hypothetical protein
MGLSAYSLGVGIIDLFMVIWYTWSTDTNILLSSTEDRWSLKSTVVRNFIEN